MILETQWLCFRRLTQDDFGNLCTILQDPKAMYAYEHAFSDEEVQQWLDRSWNATANTVWPLGCSAEADG